MLDTIQSQVAVGVTLVVVGAAFLKGDQSERIGGGACALGLLATLLLQDDSPWTGADGAQIALAGASLAVYAALAWRSRRSWPVWAAGLQGLIVMAHASALMDARPPPSATSVVVNAAGYGVLLALALGVVGAWRERRTLWLSECNR